MKNSPLQRTVDRLRKDCDSTLDLLVQEIETLEQEKESLESEIDNLKERIEELERFINS